MVIRVLTSFKEKKVQVTLACIAVSEIKELKQFKSPNFYSLNANCLAIISMHIPSS
jgi:hypothetical protein